MRTSTHPTMIEIEISDRQHSLAVDHALLRSAATLVLEGEGYTSAVVSLAIVDDRQIHELNRRWLDHDCPTDVISFVLERDEARLEGEIIVSADTAARSAERFAWPAADELLLYVVHGALHLAGYDDLSDPDRLQMRAREQHYLRQLGRDVPTGDHSAGEEHESQPAEVRP